jgi:O-antigen/teichoic acid export membrane protein
VSLLTVPSAVALFLLAEPLVAVVFGPRWQPAVPVLRALAVYAGVRSLGSYAGDLLKATGRSGLLSRLGLARAVLLVPAMIVGARFGPAGVAWALAAVTAAYLVVSLAVARRVSGAGAGDMLEAVRPALAGGLALSAVVTLWSRLAGGLHVLPALLGGAALGAAAYLVVVRLLVPRVYEDVLARLRRQPATAGSVASRPAPAPRLATEVE